jgi:hypothetical protein
MSTSDVVAAPHYTGRIVYKWSLHNFVRFDIVRRYEHMHYAYG